MSPNEPRKRKTNSSRRAQAHSGAMAVLVVLAIVVGGFIAAYEEVPEGHTGVVKDLGAVTGHTFDPGPHFTNPVTQSVQRVEIRPRTYSMVDAQGEGEKTQRRDAVVVTTINGSTVRVDVTVRYRVDADRADEFVSEWNNLRQVEQRLIRPTVRSRLRDEGAAIRTSNIYTQGGREMLADAAREELRDEFADEALVLEAVQVRDVQLPETYKTALNQKEIAKQKVQEKKFEVQQERQEAERKRVAAEAEADVIAIKGEALRKNPEVLELRYINAISPTDKVILGSSGGSATPFIIDTTTRDRAASSENRTTNSTAIGSGGG